MKYLYEVVSENYELMKKFFSSEDKPSKCIHYTSQDGFYAMFKDYIKELETNSVCKDRIKYVELFASQVQYLNDKQEYREGVEVVKKEEINSSQLFESIFVTCFCGKEDLLSQWKYYGRNCGIAIEFDFTNDVIFSWYSLGEDEIPPLSYWANLTPYKVFYEDHQSKFNVIKSIVKEISYKDITLKDAANIFVPYCKNESFREEDESRIVFYPIQSKIFGDEFLVTNVQYRTKSDKIVPQFRCKVAYSDEGKSKNFIPIKSLMVGPGNNQRLVFNSIINMIDRDKVNVKFYSDDEIDDILEKNIYLDENNKIGLHNGRITYKTTDNILISMSKIPFRD